MSGKPAARLGDPTACPSPGHGNNPITGGSPNVLFDNLPAARQGDATACGSVLSTHVIPNVLINGLPACVVDTLGSHGNLIVGGSGTVLIGNTSGSPAPSIQVPKAPKLCLQCLLLAAQRNQTFVPLESLGGRR